MGRPPRYRISLNGRPGSRTTPDGSNPGSTECMPPPKGIRWVPRSRVSTVALPGNDFGIFDDQVVVFLIFAANGLVMDRQKTTDRDAIALCRNAFDAVWKLSIPDSEYQTR